MGMSKPIKDFKHLIKAITYLFISVAMYQTNLNLPEENKYWKQFFAIIAAIFIFLTMRNLLKHMKKEYGDKIKKAVEKMWQRFSNFTKRIKEKIKKRLGIKGRNIYYGARNKRSFIFPNETRTKRTSREKAMRWRDMDTNEKKIRYLFAMFIVRRIKSGYNYRHSYTARQVKNDLADEDTSLLFDLYEVAKYTSNPHISEEEVDKVRKMK